jgi:hypothetical protein
MCTDRCDQTVHIEPRSDALNLPTAASLWLPGIGKDCWITATLGRLQHHLPSGRSYRGCTTLNDTVIICGGRNDVNLSDAPLGGPGQRLTQPHRCTTLFDSRARSSSVVATCEHATGHPKPTPLPPGTTTRTATSLHTLFDGTVFICVGHVRARYWTSEAHTTTPGDNDSYNHLVLNHAF